MLGHLKGKAVTKTAILLGVHKKGNGAPGAIRTPDPQIRSLVLYPAELRVQLAVGINGHAGGMQGRKDKKMKPFCRGAPQRAAASARADRSAMPRGIWMQN
jgi:hypothetical protein